MHLIGGKVPLPPADTCNPLRPFQPGLTLAQNILRPFALRQVKHEGYTLSVLFVEESRADEHRHTAAVLPEVFLFVWLANSSSSCDGLHAKSKIAPFRRRQIRPAQQTRDHILSTVIYHLEERLIGVKNPAIEIPGADADYIRVD